MFFVVQDLVYHTEKGTEAERALKYGGGEDTLA
jgi:hypothetical protein